MNPRKLGSAALVLIIVTLTVGLGGSVVPAEPAAPAPEFSATKTLTRTHRANGTDTEVDRRDFSVAVSQTEKLRGGQMINVAWSGAHRTLGKFTNPNAPEAVKLTEYPVVLIECRGDDTAGAPVDPSACFTQTTHERRHDSGVPFPPWRVDRHASPADRAQLIGYPDPRPEGCPPAVQPTGRFVPFEGADGTKYRPLSGLPKNHKCGPVLAPEMISVPQPAAPPGNTTYAVSDVNGNGSAKFVVLTGAENASLGCSQAVKCSLVIIPIMGISCDVAGAGVPAELAEDADAACRAPGKNPPGSVVANEDDVDAAVTGVFWWSASNWNSRITVPLHFGTPANVCDIGDNRIPLDVFGSELMTQATTQWAPGICLNRARFPFRFRHVQTGEPQAKGALAAGTASVAMVSTPPPEGYPKPTVNAPIGVSGFAVSYLMDDEGTFEYTNLRLTPRLLAKALTESYPALGTLREVYGRLPDSDPYKALKSNPFDMSTDPEFIALNPKVGNHSVTSGEVSATVLALSGTSDVTWALTSYLNADPETRAWLDGTPDPWGMVVNPGYRNLELPQLSWPLLDTFVTPEVDLYGPCLPHGSERIPPVPTGPLVASPVPTLAIAAQRVQYAIANARTLCQAIFDQGGGGQIGVQLTTKGRQGPGKRFMLAVTSLADAHFLQLNTAALQSGATVPNPAARFTDATGRVFVGPTPAAMRAAAVLAQPEQASGSWPVPYGVLRSPQGEQAYPGTMLVYASVPTTGLSADDASYAAQLLRFAVTDGQRPGLDHGQLPPGYVPITREAGLGHFVDYTLAAADAVAAQQGRVPPVVPGANPPPPSGSGAGSPDPGGGSGAAAAAAPPRQVPAAGPAPATVLPVPGKSAPVANAGSRGTTAGLASALGRWALPIAVIVALAAAVIGFGTRGGYAIYAKIRTRR